MGLDFVFSQRLQNNIKYIEASKLLENIQTFRGLSFLAKNASVKLSVFGNRVIRVKGCVDAIELNDLDHKLVNLFMQMVRNEKTPESQEAIESANHEISRLYREAEELESTCNFITWLFLKFRSLFT